ncbi:hypothetical protein [Paenibacillus naphthalenovorans]|uniref:hypothetical protein n=1 Tax=Paenibacillus naphthalenovorans TaxID=162209 RepID=UPI003D2AFFF8
MNQREMYTSAAELQRKLTTGAEITAEDVKTAGAIAASSEREEHRVLLGAVKVRYNAAMPPEQEPTPEKVTAEQLEAARAAVKANSSPDNLVRYAKLKQQYEAQEA